MVTHRCQWFQSGCHVIYIPTHYATKRKKPTIWFPWSRLYSSIVLCWISFGSCRRGRRGRYLECCFSSEILTSLAQPSITCSAPYIDAWNEVQEGMNMVVSFMLNNMRTINHMLSYWYGNVLRNAGDNRETNPRRNETNKNKLCTF